MTSKIFFSTLLFIACIRISPFALGQSSTSLKKMRGSLFLGSPGYGAGDSNPITFQNPIEYEAQIVFKNAIEVRGSGLGLLAGYRATSAYRAYATLGMGMTYTSPGLGGNVYFALGHDLFCKWLCLSAELMNALGVAKGGYLTSLYRLQIGISATLF